MTVQFKHTTLDNGLTIIAEHVPDAHTAGVGFFVKTGARDEAHDLMGVSHFLEHMMFKGSENRSAEDVDREFDELGVNHNAFTTSEMTAFWAHGLPEMLPNASSILADILQPALRQDDVDSEKNVILEEIAMYDDHPFFALYERALEEYYGANPLGHRVLGTNETVSNLQRDQIQDYFLQRYSADNTVVALAGKLDFDEMVEHITRECGNWRSTKPKRTHAPVEPEEKTFHMSLPTVVRHYMLMIAPAPSLQDDRRYAAAILANILGDTEGSRLYWALIESGLADEAQAHYDGRDGTGEFLVLCTCSPDQAKQIEQITRREIDDLLDSLTDDDLVRVRSKVATSATLAGELPAGRMRRLGQLWNYHGEYRSLEEELARINAVTLDDLRAVHEAYPMTPIVVGHMAPPEH